MIFSSPVFLLCFLPVVVLLYYLPLRRCRSGQNILLLVFSLLFYAWGEKWFVLVMMASMAVDCCNIQLYLPAVNMLAGFVISGIAGDRRFSSSGLLIFVLITLYIILFCFAL